MIDFSQTRINRIAVHTIGDPGDPTRVQLYNGELTISEHLHTLLLRYFLTSFSSPDFYAFPAADEPAQEAIRRMTDAIFAEPESLFPHTCEIARHLAAASRHPFIKPGDLFVA